MKPVTSLRIKSVISSPVDGSAVPTGPVKIQGVAWSNGSPVLRVDVLVVHFPDIRGLEILHGSLGDAVILKGFWHEVEFRVPVAAILLDLGERLPHPLRDPPRIA